MLKNIDERIPELENKFLENNEKLSLHLISLEQKVFQFDSKNAQIDDNELL